MRYKTLASDLAGLIRCGSLAPGMRLPSVREVTKSHGVSPATVFRAYRLLEAQGLIEARPRAGHFVSPQACARIDGPVFIGAGGAGLSLETDDLLFHVLESSRKPGVVPLGSAFPGPAMFPASSLNRSLAAVAREMGAETPFAELSAGAASLRCQIVRRYLTMGLTVPSDEVIVTSGALEALTLALEALTDPGDFVAIQAPAFYATLQTLDRLRLKGVEIPMHPSGGLDVSVLAAALSRYPVRACWFMNSFQNPTGATLPEAGKQALVALLAQHDIPLIEDDVYAELYLGISPVRPAKAFDQNGLVLHCGSFSKSLAPCYRVGWVAAGRFAQRIARAKLMTNISTSLPAQLAIAAFLQSRSYERHLHQLRRRLATQRDIMLDVIGRAFPPGTQVRCPDGGYFLWVELPEQVDAVRLFEMALDQGISIAPGPIFSKRRGYRNYIRLNYGHPWTPEIERGVEAVGRLSHSLC